MAADLPGFASLAVAAGPVNPLKKSVDWPFRKSVAIPLSAKLFVQDATDFSIAGGRQKIYVGNVATTRSIHLPINIMLKGIIAMQKHKFVDTEAMLCKIRL